MTGKQGLISLPQLPHGTSWLSWEAQGWTGLIFVPVAWHHFALGGPSSPSGSTQADVPACWVRHHVATAQGRQGGGVCVRSAGLGGQAEEAVASPS